MVWFALFVLALSLLPLVWIICDDRARVSECRKYRAAEAARLASRTTAEKRQDAQMACLLVAGFVPDHLLSDGWDG